MIKLLEKKINAGELDSKRAMYDGVRMSAST